MKAIYYRRQAMLARTQQNGISFWGLLVVAAVSVFFLLLFFKLLPHYIEYGKVKNALASVAQQSNAMGMEKGEIKAALDRRFNIEDVNLDLNKVLIVEKKPGVTIIRITYERREHFAYNVSVHMDFDESVQVKAR
jgi:Domain of unknown function (DUF4845)